jgi:hypothetical protein
VHERAFELYDVYMSEAPFELFETYRPVVLSAHILGVILGLGGASVSDLLFFRFLRDYRISAKEAEVLGLLKNLIMGALAVVLVSGVILVALDPVRYWASDPFRLKALVTLVVALNGIALHLIVAPHLIHLNLRHPHPVHGRRWRRLAFALGGVSVCSWYTVFFTAMLKSLMPQDFVLLLCGYLVLLAVTLCGTQIVESFMTARASR